MQAFAGEDAKPYLDLVEPAGRRGREVKAHVGMLGQPVIISLMGCVVVQDHMDVLAHGHVSHHLIEEGLKIGALFGSGDFVRSRSDNCCSGADDFTGACVVLVRSGR